MKKLLAVVAIAGTLVACNNEAETTTESTDTTTTITTDTMTTAPVTTDTTTLGTDTTGAAVGTDTSAAQ